MLDGVELMSQVQISADESSSSTKTNGANQRKAKAGPFRNKCTGGKLAANGRKFNLLDKKEEEIAKRFKIVLTEKPNLQEAAERSRNRQYFRCCFCCRSHINSHNQVRGHRIGSSHSGAEEYPRGKTQTKGGTRINHS